MAIIKSFKHDYRISESMFRWSVVSGRWIGGLLGKWLVDLIKPNTSGWLFLEVLQAVPELKDENDYSDLSG